MDGVQGATLDGEPVGVRRGQVGPIGWVDDDPNPQTQAVFRVRLVRDPCIAEALRMIWFVASFMADRSFDALEPAIFSETSDIDCIEDCPSGPMSWELWWVNCCPDCDRRLKSESRPLGCPTTAIPNLEWSLKPRSRGKP